MLILKLAARNLARNFVRTLLNIIMIVGAFCAIILFQGFSNNILKAMGDSIVEGVNGHIQIATKDVWTNEPTKKKEDALIAGYSQIIKKILDLPEVNNSFARLSTYVLLSNGNNNVGALVVGYESKVATQVKKVLKVTEGQWFSNQGDEETLVGIGIQKQLALKIGQPLTIVSQTVTGAMSSAEPEVRGVVGSGLKEIDDITLYMPLAAVQKFMETDRAQWISISLRDNVNLNLALDKIKNIIRDRPELLAKDWKETAEFFRQLVDFYKAQNGLVQLILSFLVFFGILNTVSMSIFERIGEIGTLRALGDTDRDILLLFIVEGILLGIVGVLIATPLAHGIASLISSLQIQLMLPGSSFPIPLEVEPYLNDYLAASIAVTISCLISILIPSLKALRFSIVDALRANS